MDFTDKVAIVTGGGRGLGRQYCLELARRGARIVINDLGASVDGQGASDAAYEVVAEIEAAGGTAIANGASVTDANAMAAMVENVLDRFGRIDLLVANAGILRDKSFSKMPLDDFRTVIEVHLMGTVNAIKAVWPVMTRQQGGRIVVTTSTAGLFGNFGQTNYGAAKTAVIGLMNSLNIEGHKAGIKVNCISPFAVTRMSESLTSPEIAAVMKPEHVAQGVVWLASDAAPAGVILNAGSGRFSTTRIVESPGIAFPLDAARAENVAEAWTKISDPGGERGFGSALEHSADFLQRAPAAG
jgi:NAD(P)-dependent dehydrogenase (short-subunit alcohol dehydrogenase family)